MLFTDLRQMASEKLVFKQFQFEHAIIKFSLSGKDYKTCTLKICGWSSMLILSFS